MHNEFQKHRLIATLLNKQQKLLVNEPLDKHTTFQIGGNAQYFVMVQDLDNLKDVVKLALENNLSYFIIGGGSNLLISDQGFSGIVIKLGREFSLIEIQGNKIICGAGVKLVNMVKAAYENNLTGAEFLYGIPGTIGGAIKNNAGAFFHSISDIIESVNGIHIDAKFVESTLRREDPTREVTDLRLKKEQIGFSYRASQLPKDFILTWVVIKLSEGNRKKIRSEMKRIKKCRSETQPWGASAGSIFKNPKQEPAGRLLDEAGLKGLQIGGAYISSKHANFIINRGGARFNDVSELIQIMKMRVEEKTGIILEEEVEIVPNE
jgi:UDP-N-acetylmuramate dehydrogenase